MTCYQFTMPHSIYAHSHDAYMKKIYLRNMRAYYADMMLDYSVELRKYPQLPL